MDRDLQLQLFRSMLRIRIVEEKIAERYAEQEMRCPVHLCVGQEAPPVGVCAHLTRSDQVLGAHRSHGHYLAKGGGLKAMLAELYGRETGCSRGFGGSMHLTDLAAGFLAATPIVGSTIAIAVGAAFGSVLRGIPRVVAVFFGEAATEEGIFGEALNFAALKRLPVVFVCENNLYSVYSPLSVRQPSNRDLLGMARAHGIEAWKGDGNDVNDVYALAGRAVGHAREGRGPSLLELATYRWREHCGPLYDNDMGYRTEGEFLEWKARCPIDRMRNRLLGTNGIGPKDLDLISQEVTREVEEAFRFAQESRFAVPSGNPARADAP